MPARRDETGKRARQGSPVAKRRARNPNTNRRQRRDDRKYRRKVLEIVVLPNPKKLPGRLPVEASGGAAAALLVGARGCGGAPKKNRAAPRDGDAARR